VFINELAPENKNSALIKFGHNLPLDITVEFFGKKKKQRRKNKKNKAEPEPHTSGTKG